MLDVGVLTTTRYRRELPCMGLAQVYNYKGEWFFELLRDVYV